MMIQTIMALFTDAALAEKAAHDLLEYGSHQEDIKLVFREEQVGNITESADHQEELTGVTQIGLGVVAGMASTLGPGLGMVLGGGALASFVGTGVMSDDIPAIVDSERVILSIQLPSGPVDIAWAREVLAKYGAETIHTA